MFLPLAFGTLLVEYCTSGIEMFSYAGVMGIGKGSEDEEIFEKFGWA